MTRSRAERYRLMAAHKAAYMALEASLKNEAAEEYEREQVRVTWELPGGGSVYASLRKDATTVGDPEALLTWAKTFYPEHVYTVQQLRSAWVDVLLKQAVPVALLDGDPEPDDATPGQNLAVIDPQTGQIIPGLIWTKGGGLASVSVKNDPAAMKRMHLAAAAYAEGTGTMPGLESGES